MSLKKDNVHFPPKNSDDEQLDAEAEEMGGFQNPSYESEEEETEETIEPDATWQEARHLEIEKPDSALELELETSLEQTDEQEVVDDPVRMYLHEIGRVPLLTADEEKDLARKMEEGRRIKQIRQGYLKKYDREPSATEIIITILQELSQAAPIIQLIQEDLQLPPAASFAKNISSQKLRASIDSEISPKLILAVAQQSQKSIAETELLLTELSLNINLLPQEVLNAVGDSISTAGIESLVTELDFINSIKAYEERLQTYLENIEREAERAESHLIEANLRLVVSVAKKHIGRGMSLLDLIQRGISA
jgi:RNA polymerase primary sigma factor